MLRNKENSKKQANVGMGIAIGYFATKGWTVCVPLTDSQDYDLVVEEGNILKKVQVKTTYYKNKLEKYVVELRTKTHHRGKLYSIKSLGFFDYMFVLTEDGKKYLIPKDKITVKSGLVLTKAWDKFLVV